MFIGAGSLVFANRILQEFRECQVALHGELASNERGFGCDLYQITTPKTDESVCRIFSRNVVRKSLTQVNRLETERAGPLAALTSILLNFQQRFAANSVNTGILTYSSRRLFTGFDAAALNTWYPTVTMVITAANKAANKNVGHSPVRSIR